MCSAFGDERGKGEKDEVRKGQGHESGSWVGGSEDVREVGLQAGFSVCALEVLEGADWVYFSLMWEFSVACLCWEAWTVVTSC